MSHAWPALVLVGLLAAAGCGGKAGRESAPETSTAQADAEAPDTSEVEQAIDLREPGEIEAGQVPSETADSSDTSAPTDSTSDLPTHAPDAGLDGIEGADLHETTAAPDPGDSTTTPADTTIEAEGLGPEDSPADVEDVPPEASSDLIFGTEVPRASSWWVGRGRLHRGAEQVRLRGINWFGLETADRALHGTWFGRTVEDFLAELRGLGFDSLRVPVSPESINAGFASAGWANEAYTSGPASTGREHLERLIDAAAAADITLLLDFHSCSSTQIGGALPGRPDGCPGYDIARWLADLTELATLARGHGHVLGIDLVNEPHQLTWSAWKVLAERGGEAVLRANPRLLVFVEGVAGASDYAGNYPFWGENLTEAGTDPPAIPASRLVFSPHVYGPGIAAQSYFSAADFPANMPAIWNSHFGNLVPEYALVPGEFGGHHDAAHPGEIAWNEAFVAYLSTLDRGQPVSFFYWAVNPNSGDTGGLYLDDWRTLVTRRLTLLSPLLAP